MELVERYLYDIGRRLPPKTRDDILAELRSVVQDKLDERVGEGQPSRTQVIDVLKDMGSPKKVAASFAGERYLIGPALYPTMMRVVQIGMWSLLVIPALGMWSLLTTEFASASAAFEMAVGKLWDYVNAVIFFIGMVVTIFAILERQDVKVPDEEEKWNPESLPDVSQPGRVSYVEMGVDIAFNFVTFAILSYFFQQGGLPMVFFGETPGAIVPISAELFIGLIIVTAFQIAVQFYVMNRGWWQIPTRLADALFDIVGLILGYAMVTQYTSQLVEIAPYLRQIGVPDWIFPGVFGIIAVIVMGVHVFEIYRLVTHRPVAPPPIKASPAKG